jgi:diguanylate cyclase (GGDEF)-like protein
MKSERSRARVASTDYTQRVEAPVPVSVAASVFGIPDNEFTPRVRDAIMTQFGELESLRRELEFTRAALDEMKDVADRDQLLPILNRRAFVRELTRYISFAVRYGTPASLVYFDLDGFKQINDTFGHAAGDAVLEHFTQALLTNVRDSDVAGRLGGDEFGIILTNANESQANAKAAMLAKLLGDKPLAWQDKAIPIGFSFGAFELSASDSANIAIARADEAMYAHKRGAGTKR